MSGAPSREMQVPVLEKPAVQDSEIIACLKADYGLRSKDLAFLPLGQDLSTAVYRVVADDGTPYFCRLKRGAFNEISVELPKFLSEQGITQVIPPLVTKTGRLWAKLDEFTLILYPFVEGKNGYDVALSERQWAEFGAALKRIHTTEIPPALSQKIHTENYATEGVETCRFIIKRLDQESFSDPIAIQFTALFNSQRRTILDQMERAERLARCCAARKQEFVLCHSDIHPGNVYIDTQGALYIVDWDRPILAPKERDLMFIGGGQGFICPTPQEEESRFSLGYGPMEIDPIALAYCRYTRNLTDISVEFTRILSSSVSKQDREFSLQILNWYFAPGGTIDMAYKSDKTQ